MQLQFLAPVELFFKQLNGCSFLRLRGREKRKKTKREERTKENERENREDDDRLIVHLGRLTVFYSLRIEKSMQLQFSIFLNFLVLQLQFFFLKIFPELFSYAVTVFFAGVNSA